jgi:MFS transporter, FHS family, glucose/mannose:H+ symporter
MSKTSTLNPKLLTFGAFFSFLIFGFVDNIKGPTLPVILTDFNFSYSIGGSIILVAYFGFLVATLITGPAADRVGNKAIIIFAGLFLLFGLGGYSLSMKAWMLTTAMFFIGMGIGAIEVGGNLIIIDIHSHDKGRFLNLLALCHGAGSMAAPLAAGQMIAIGFTWRNVYQYSLAFVLLLLLYFFIVRYPWDRGAKKPSDLKKFGAAAFSGDMILLYLSICVYVAAEVGVGAWLVEFLQKVKSQSVMKSSVYLSLFFGTAMAGRFIGSFFVDRVGYLKSMLIASIASILFMAIGTFGPPALSIFIPLTGFFFSIIFPTVTAAVADLHEENIGAILGILFMFGGLGAMLGSWSVGVTSDVFGINIGFGMVLILCIVMTALFGILILKRR